MSGTIGRKESQCRGLIFILMYATHHLEDKPGTKDYIKKPGENTDYCDFTQSGLFFNLSERL